MKKYFILFLFILYTTVSAQNTSGSYQIKWVNDIQGLSNLTVSNAVLDDSGIVWIATDLGLFSYDGTIVKPVLSEKIPQLNSKRIVSLFKDNDSGLIGFSAYPDENSFTIKKGIIKRIDPSKETIFVDLYLHSSNPFFKSFNSFYNNFGKTIDDKEYKDNLLTNNHLYILFLNKLYTLEKNGTYSFSTTNVNNFFICDFKEAIITIGDKMGLVSNKKILYNKIAVDSVLKNFISSYDNLNKPNAIINSNDKYYLNFESKIYEINFRNNKLSTTFLFELKNQEIMWLSYSPKGKLYFVGTANSGFAIVSLNTFNTIASLNNNVEYVIVNNKSKWYSFNGWVHNTETKKTIERTISDNYHGNMRFLLEYDNNFFYESLNGDLTSLIDCTTKAPFNVKGLNFLTGYTYLNNQLWLANTRKCAYLKNNQLIIDSIVTKKLKKNQDINTISTFQNQLIFATSNGVFLHKPFTNNFTYIKGLENVNARYIKFINKNSFWVGCYGEGLYLVVNNKVFKVKDKNNLINTTHAIEEDKSGNLWISTNNGLFLVNKKQAIKNILNNDFIESYVYTTEDGLPFNEFNGGSTFPSLNTNGIIGFPSMKGYVWFKPNEVPKNLFSGDIIIEKAAVNNKIIKPNSNQQFTIPKAAEAVYLTFKYGYYFNKQNITVSYKFQDENTWTKIDENKIQIPRHKYGVQLLFIKIHTHGFDRKYDVIKTVKLDFEKRYYESLWFWLLVGLLFLIFVYSAFLIGRFFKNKNKRLLEQKIEEKTIILKEAIYEVETSKEVLNQTLFEKEILLKEVHHRVKNNLQLIMSMLNIQARRKNYESIFEFLKKGESRINAMALIHQRLYQEDKAINKINLQAYLEELVDSINKTFSDEYKNIEINIDCEEVMVNLSTAIPLGLIINELTTNSIKHAFHNRDSGFISIKIKKINNHYNLIFEDNGIGFNKKNNYSSSFGLELIDLLVKQLKGKCSFENKNKSKYLISFYEIDI